MVKIRYIKDHKGKRAGMVERVSTNEAFTLVDELKVAKIARSPQTRMMRPEGSKKRYKTKKYGL